MTTTRPILFNAEMVRAILSGAKTQTRRVIKPQPENVTRAFHGGSGTWQLRDPDTEDISVFIHSPYGEPGDQLWVRETFTTAHPLQTAGRPSRRSPAGIPGPPGVDYRAVYRADGELPPIYYCEDHPFRSLAPDPDYGGAVEAGGWTPSIHMPRWASRIALEVVDVRVERVKDIRDADILAEGVPQNGSSVDRMGLTRCGDLCARFRDLWDGINAKRGYGWESNPWVWAVTFKRVDIKGAA